MANPIFCSPKKKSQSLLTDVSGTYMDCDYSDLDLSKSIVIFLNFTANYQSN